MGSIESFENQIATLNVLDTGGISNLLKFLENAPILILFLSPALMPLIKI